MDIWLICDATCAALLSVSLSSTESVGSTVSVTLGNPTSARMGTGTPVDGAFASSLTALGIPMASMTTGLQLRGAARRFPPSTLSTMVSLTVAFVSTMVSITLV